MRLRVGQMQFCQDALIESSKQVVENVEVSLMRKVKCDACFFEHKVVDFGLNIKKNTLANRVPPNEPKKKTKFHSIRLDSKHYRFQGRRYHWFSAQYTSQNVLSSYWCRSMRSQTLLLLSMPSMTNTICWCEKLRIAKTNRNLVYLRFQILVVWRYFSQILDEILSRFGFARTSFAVQYDRVVLPIQLLETSIAERQIRNHRWRTYSFLLNGSAVDMRAKPIQMRLLVRTAHGIVVNPFCLE